LYKFIRISRFFLGEEVRVVVLSPGHNDLEAFKTNGPRDFSETRLSPSEIKHGK
jgi:hypothetical protein